jgi:hypothetical protein
MGWLPFPCPDAKPQLGQLVTYTVLGYPVSFNGTGRLSEVGKSLVRQLRHVESRHLDSHGAMEVGRLAQAAQFPVACVLDALLFSWNRDRQEFRFEVYAEATDIEDVHSHIRNGGRLALYGRARRGHSVAIM